MCCVVNVQISSMIEIEVEMDNDVLAAEGAAATVSHNFFISTRNLLPL